MRPLQLTISGLHSFRESQTIDFGSLSSVGLFGIFGPTGSGKSTILDAMTLALYGEVGRAGNHTQGILNHAEARVHVSFDFCVGTGEKRRTFRVERHYKRGDEMSVLHHASRMLEILEGEDAVVLADTKNEVTRRIKDVIGLEPSDFTRAVVLPQGKFAEFLQLSGVERNRMTERLFGLERYGQRLVDTIAVREREAKTQLDTVIRLLEQMGDASADALAVSQEALVHASDAVERAAERMRTMDEDLGRMREGRRDTVQLERLEAEWQVHNQRSAEMLMMVQAMDQSARAMPVLTAAHAHDVASADLEQRMVEEAGSEAEVRATREAVRRESDTKARCEEAKSMEEPRLLAKLDQLQEAKTMEAEWAQTAQQFEAAEQAFASCGAALHEVEVAFAAHEEAVLNAQSELSAREEAQQRAFVAQPEREVGHIVAALLERWRNQTDFLDSLQTELSQRREHRENLLMQRDALRMEQEALQSTLDAFCAPIPSDALTEAWIQQLSLHVTTLVDRLRTFRKHRQTVVEARKTVYALTASRQEKESEVERQRKQLDEVEAAYEAKRTEAGWLRPHQRQQAAYLLALDLLDGDPCPVCGSVSHPKRAAQFVSSDNTIVEGMGDVGLDTLRADVEMQALAWQEAKAELTQVDAKLESSTMWLERALAEDHEQCERLGQAADTLGDMWGGLGLHSNPLPFGRRAFQFPDEGDVQDTDLSEEALWTAHSALREEYEAANRDRLVQSERLANQEARLRDVRETLAIRSAELGSAEREIERLQNDIIHVETTLQSVRERVEEALTQLHIPCSTSGLMDAAASWVRGLSRRDKAYDACVQETALARQRLDRAMDERMRLQALRGTLVVKHVEAKNELDNYARQMTRLETQMKPLLEGASSIEQAILGLVDRLEWLNRQLDEANQALSQAVEADRLADIRYAEVMERKRGALRDVEEAREQMAASLEESAFSTVEAARSAVLTPDERTRYEAMVSEHQETGALLNDRIQTLQVKLGALRINEDDLQRVEEARKATATALEQSIDHRGRMQEAYNTLSQKHGEWVRLTEQKGQLETDWDRLCDLKATVRGNAFVEYVARGQLESVARDASMRLSRLTRGRYALEVTADGGFVMADLHNGGVRRPVSSLSGGETFLTSLALALSLSSQIQLRGQYPLEFFFLDEGFGTLDPELLDTVISTLEQLHVERFVIGLISHVPELRQRLSRRLIVEPPQPGGRGTRVKVEQA